MPFYLEDKNLQLSSVTYRVPSAQEMSNGMIVSVSEARKILGDEYSTLSEEELGGLILDLHELAQTILKSISQGKSL